jgi:hypothetical protein
VARTGDRLLARGSAVNEPPHREGMHHGPKDQSELRSLGQAEAYPTKSRPF